MGGACIGGTIDACVCNGGGGGGERGRGEWKGREGEERSEGEANEFLDNPEEQTSSAAPRNWTTTTSRSPKW